MYRESLDFVTPVRAEGASRRRSEREIQQFGCRQEQEWYNRGRTRVGVAVPLLSQSSSSDLLVRDAHNQGHLGVAATTSKARATAWVINLPKVSKNVVRGCYGCRLYNKEAVQQFLGSPPYERLKPSLPFTNVCLDLFGPINVSLTKSKTDIGKAYGVIINN